MVFFQVAPLLAFISNLLLSVYVLSRDWRSKVNVIYFFWGLSLGIWNLGAFLMFRVQDEHEALIVARFLHFGVAFIPVLFTHLALLIGEFRVPRIVHYCYAIPVIIAASNFSDLLIAGVQQVSYAYFATAGPMYWVLSSLVPAMGIPSVFLMLRRMRSRNKLYRRRVGVVAAALVLLMVFGTHDLLPVLGIYFYPGTSITVYPLGTIAAFFFPLAVSYSVLQSQLLDIRITLGRSAAMVVRMLFLITFAFILLFLAALIRPDDFTIYPFFVCLTVIVASAIVTSIFFPKLLGPGTERLERRILGDRFEYQDQLRSFIEAIPFFANADRLLDETEKILRDTLHPNSLTIAIVDEKSRQLSVIKQHPGMPVASSEFSEDDHPILSYFRRMDVKVINFRSLENRLLPNPLEEAVIEATLPLKPDLCFALSLGREPFGFILLGSKQSHEPYTSLDLELLDTLAGNISLVLDQIRLKHQVAQTEQLESLAVMSRGLAHDLNNLVTPIYTYLQLENDRPKDEVPAPDLLGIAWKNLETIRAYVREAIFFSTTQKPHFKTVSLERLADLAYQITRSHMEAAKISFELQVTPGIICQGDEILLQRMLANFIFNSIDASPPKSTISLRMFALSRRAGRRNWIRLEVIDQGTGIPRENLERVFTPYFTTKDSGDHARGFGLGLSICRKIVLLHQGTITVYSREGSGTTFQVDLPMSPEGPERLPAPLRS